MKRLFVLMLSGVIFASSVSMDANAATASIVSKEAFATSEPAAIIKGEPNGSTSQPSDAALEGAIKAVKGKIAIPAQYSIFNYYFNDASTYSDGFWNLTWSTTDRNSQINVSCDENYHITSFSHYDASQKENGISKYLIKELKDTADQFISDVAPETNGKLEYLNANFDSVYSGNYVYQYRRVENGIPFPDNTVQVYVNSSTGKVTALNINWLYNAKLPSSTTEITKEKATQLIKNNMKMKLTYRSDYFSIYDQRYSGAKKAFLVYEPTQSYISIDAKTGKVYLTKTEWSNVRGGMEKAADASTTEAAMAGASSQLTEEEIAKVKELQNIISKDKAIKTITDNSVLYLDKNLTSYEATLSKMDDSSLKSSYVWNITLSDPREINYEKDKSSYRAYAYASVDAVSGKILSFYASVKSYYDEMSKKWTAVKIPYDQKKAQAILETFLKKQMNSRFQNSVLSEAADDYVVYYKNDKPVYGGYNYRYNRLNEGIEYPYNNIYGSVDGVTGKIYSYGAYWDENITFEAPKGVMTAEKAMEAYLSKKGYELQYEINQIVKDTSSKQAKSSTAAMDLSSVTYEVRLVYHPAINPSYLSPFTGEQLNNRGEVYTETKPYTYKDITNDSNYRDILLLSDMNIGFEGENFLPNQPITVSELNELLNKIGYSYPEDTASTKDNSLITREAIAQTFINKLGLEKLAKLSGIYKTGFADENLIDTKYLGAVALAKGYGLVTSDAENKFNPKSNITRLDAVKLMLKYIEVQKSGVY